jgi:hypothetical protein
MLPALLAGFVCDELKNIEYKTQFNLVSVLIETF